MSNLALLLDQTIDIENLLYYEQKNQLYNKQFINLIIDSSIKDLKVRIKRSKEISFQPIFASHTEEKNTLFKLLSFLGNIDLDSKNYYKINLFAPNILLNSHFPIYLFSDEKYNIKISFPNKEIFIKNVNHKSSIFLAKETSLENIEHLNISEEDANFISSNINEYKISIQLSKKGKVRDNIFEKQNQEKYIELNTNIEHTWISELKNTYIQMLHFGSAPFEKITKSQLRKELRENLEFFNVSFSDDEVFNLIDKVNEIKFQRKDLIYFPAIHHFYSKLKRFSLNGMNIELTYSNSVEVDNVLKLFYERELSLIKQSK